MPQEGTQEAGAGQEQAQQQEHQQAKTFDESYVKQLRGEAAGYRTKVGELESRLKEFDDRDKSAAQKLEERATSAESKLTAAEQRLARYDAAVKAGLSLKHAGRIQGSTPDEMQKDAEELAKEFGGDNGGGSGFDAGARGGQPPAGDMNARIRRAAGRTT